PRAIPLLVDLLGQETNPTLIDTLQQALASTGTNSLPALRNLNQAIHNDLAALVNSETGRKTANLRLRATKQAIAKVLNIYSGRLQNSNLQRIDLSSVTAGEGEFNLILEQVDLSGLNLRSSLLRDSDFYKSIFYSAGKDRRLGTFDDVTSDFSGADLQGANLSETLLNKAKFKRANLIQVNLSKANISEANFQQANLSSAKLIAVNGQYSQFKQASLTGADLTKSDFTSSNWQSANLGKSSAIGTKFIQSNLQQSNWQGADLSQTDFTNSDLSSTDLSYSQLRAAKLQNVNLTNANLSYADLSSADLRGANLKNANFLGVVLVESIKSNIDSFMPTPTSQSAVKIQGVDFSEVKNLSDEQIEFICNNGGYHPFCRNR
ncbi:MAG: pentapeptide repeat-containing protein, partial [Cyanobacteria bacterium J083]